MIATQSARGVRNNNPGNIRHGQPWVGLAPLQTDPTFCQFVDAEHGIRAIAMTLITYQDVHRLHTVREMISRWAPPNLPPDLVVEGVSQDNNDTEAYIRAVTAEMGIGDHDRFSIHNKPLAAKMIYAIIHQENGYSPYPVVKIDAGLALAGIV